MKNKLDSFFSHMLFVPQASQSSLYRGQNLRFCPRFLRQKIIACGMEMSDEENVICGNCVVDCHCGDISVR